MVSPNVYSVLTQLLSIGDSSYPKKVLYSSHWVELLPLAQLRPRAALFIVGLGFRV